MADSVSSRLAASPILEFDTEKEVRSLAAWLVTSCILAPAFTACSAPEDSATDASADPVIDVSADDPEMNAAIAQARELLPHFCQVFENPTQGESDFSLKVRIEDGDNVEYFWVTDVRRDAGKIHGVIANEAIRVRNVMLGDEIEVVDDSIADWLYWRDGRMVGNFTLRALFRHMPDEQVEKLKAMMAEP